VNILSADDDGIITIIIYSAIDGWSLE
jgi:hypothetical protein